MVNHKPEAVATVEDRMVPIALGLQLDRSYRSSCLQFLDSFAGKDQVGAVEVTKSATMDAIGVIAVEGMPVASHDPLVERN